MSHVWRLPLILSLAFLLPALAHAQEAEPARAGSPPGFDTEHIFGFAEGSDIGVMGEREIESVTIGSFGAPAGGYANIDNETSFRYGVTNDLRLSIGTLTDYFNIHDVPGLGDRSDPELSGLITEARWHILDWRTSPFGMTLSLNPQWRRTDPTSGQSSGNYAIPATLLIDKEVIPSKFFTVLNLIYMPSFLRPNGKPEHDDAFTIIAGGSYAITPNILFGTEVRHENLAQNGNLNAHALFVGPQLFVSLAKNLSAKIAWAAQIPDIAAHSLDLTSYQRHQVEFQFAYSF
jgi:hypothetical protein